SKVSFAGNARLSASTRSTTTEGGFRSSCVWAFGLTTQAPLLVANQSRPSLPFQAPGLATPLHNSLAMPSPLPYAILTTCRFEPCPHDSRSWRLTRQIPFVQLIQTHPRSSSRISQIVSLNIPFALVNAVNVPS